MAEETEAPAAGEKHITFNIKSSSDSKYTLTVPESMTVLELKEKLATKEYADVEPGRQRLIYSGRVLKDADKLEAYKIKDGNTVHMVKGAPLRPQSDSASTNPTIPAPIVPSNIQTGTGTDPLAGLTGARYAGFAQMPGASMFGPDGGMGPPQGPDELLRQLENPMFQSQMTEAMNNPQFIQMMQNNPMVRDNPWLRQALENPEMRRMMMDPEVIRQSMRMSQAFGGGGPGQNVSMPAPGVTETTPQQQGAATGAGTTGTTGTTPQPNTTRSPPPNPFGMFGQPGLGGGQANPFAALFGNGSPFGANAGAGQTNTSENPTGEQGQGRQGQTQSPAQNPLAGLLGSQGAGGQQNPIAAMTQQMMQNPEMMRMAMQSMGLGGDQGQGQNPAQGLGSPGQQANPFLNPLLFGGLGGQQQQQQDSRPPEEQYADQLRQLNDMGFYEFERNVRALRMAGGSVQGAIEVLLSGVS